MGNGEWSMVKGEWSMVNGISAKLLNLNLKAQTIIILA
jgi:hypothetical protein